MNMNAKIIVALVLACLLVGSAYAYAGSFFFAPADAPSAALEERIAKSIESTKLSLTVMVHDSEGNLKAYQHDPDDPINRNFVNLMNIFLYNAKQSQLPALYADDGQSYTPHLHVPVSGGTGYSYWFNSHDFFIGIGTGSGTATASTYQLFEKYGDYYQPSSVVYVNGSIIITCSIPISGTATITNVGGFMRGGSYYSSVDYGIWYANDFMMFHDNINAINVVAGDVVTVVYNLTLAPQFTDNFRAFVKMALTPAPLVGTGHVTFTDTSGSSFTALMVCGRDVNNFMFDSDIVPSIPNLLFVGNGTAPVSRTSYALSSPVGSGYPINYARNDTYIVAGASGVATANLTLTEMGVVSYVCDDGPNTAKPVLMWRDVFDQTVVDAG
ncbi:MAG: hypothetical protein ABC596_09570, partial [Candidatus Methanosuratincola petrocarbonis]